jgi:Fe-S cluster assembly protein SufD
LTPTGLATFAGPGAPHVATDGAPPWLTAARDRSAAYVAEHGFPTRKHEDWRYVRLEKLFEIPFGPLPGVGSDAATAADPVVAELLAVVPDLGGPRAVFVDGRLVPSASRLDDQPAGLHVSDLATALAESSETLEHELVEPEPTHAFEALNAALAATGLVVRVDEGAHVDQPVHLIHLLTGHGEPLLVNLRSLVTVGAGGSVTVVASSLGASDATGYVNTTTRALLAPGATLAHRDVQDEPEGAYHLGLLDITQQAESRFAGHVSAIGGAVARHEVHVRQVGADATTELDGLYVPSGDQQHDHPILIEHLAPGGVSRQAYRGVIDGRAHGVFNGRIIVHPGAAGIDADQSNRNLLLSEQAEADTRPRLEIYADDVKCTHGASVGRLDEESLFYLRSRGIGVDEARRVLTYAFVEEIVDRLGEGPLHDRIEGLVSARLHPDPDRRSESAR